MTWTSDAAIVMTVVQSCRKYIHCVAGWQLFQKTLTLRMYAASNGKASIIRALLTAKARVDEVDERGATWLMEQMRSNEQPCCSLKDVFNKCGFDVVRKTKTASWHLYIFVCLDILTQSYLRFVWQMNSCYPVSPMHMRIFIMYFLHEIYKRAMQCCILCISSLIPQVHRYLLMVLVWICVEYLDRII